MVVFSQLPEDAWHLIIEKLHHTADRIRFRSVCRSWRSRVPFPQPPWLMLAQNGKSHNTCGFFGLGRPPQLKEQKVYQIELPETHLARCIGSTGKWLITVDNQERMCLLNPFSRLQISLPPQRKYEPGFAYHLGDLLTLVQLRDSLLRKAIMSSPPSGTRDCVVMVVHEKWKRLAIARPVDEFWTDIPTPYTYLVKDIIFYKGQFYGIDHYGVLTVIDVGDHQNPPGVSMLNDKSFQGRSDGKLFYLVEWMGELVCVIKLTDDDDRDSFQLYVFDFTNKSWDELNSLGEHSLFLGDNRSAAVLASDYPGLERNCIYFTDDYILGYCRIKIAGDSDIQVFELEDESIINHKKCTYACRYSPPLWIVP